MKLTKDAPPPSPTRPPSYLTAAPNPPPTGAGTPAWRSRWPLEWWLPAILAVATIWLYWPARQADFVFFDDPDYVTANPHVLAGLSLTNLRWAFRTSAAANWHPVTWLSLMLDTSLFGKGAAGFHLTNLVLHAVNSALLFWLLWILTGARWRSFLVAALFAWHPLRVESVAWISERKDVLSMFFGLLALLYYVRYARASERPPETSAPPPGNPAFPKAPAYWLAWTCLALGLMSKSMLVTWPFVMVLLDFWPLQRFQRHRLRALIVEKLPFFLLVVGSSVVTYLVQKIGLAMATFQSMPADMRLENAVVAYCHYLGMTFWPVKLAAFYPHPGYWPGSQIILAVLLLTGFTLLFWARRGTLPFLLTGWLWYCGTLVPVIGLVQVGGQALADRYTYVPSVGLLIVVVWGGWELVRSRRFLTVALLVAGLAAIVVCLVLTRRQIENWRNSETLFRHAIAVTERNFVAHDGLGCLLFARGQTNEGINEFQQAIFLKPSYANAHFNLGNSLRQQGQTNAAIIEFQIDLQLDPANAKPYFELGNLLAKLGRTEAAITNYQAAIRLDPEDPEAPYELGNLLSAEGQPEAAIQAYETAVRVKPDFAEAHNNLATVLTRLGRFKEAIGQFQAATLLKPDYAEAHYNYGNLLLQLGQLEEAAAQLKEAVRLKPESAPAHFNFGVALYKAGQTNPAVSEFQTAIHLNPNYVLAHNSLGTALAAQGRLDEAINQFQEALRLKPDFARAQSNLVKTLELKSK